MVSAFEKELARLKKKNPGHDILPIIEEMGACALAMMYIDIALKDEVVVSSSEDQIRTYFKLKDKLYSQRAVYSNKFHDCASDAERAEISIAIGSIQTEIVNVRRIIDEYQETGVLPKSQKGKPVVLDGRRKQKKLGSVRSSISYFKGLIRKELDPEKIKSYERSIERLQSTAKELSV